ncbi:hypothetical protein ACH4GK_17765 [Streptomyces rimosus]|uniref:hypothetical protein n=1 Tax=Streptomyces rimosus TaxID=1927 RepID=UPI0004C7B7D6|nr:hypothetical protein [Streptomyces rimosus]
MTSPQKAEHRPDYPPKTPPPPKRPVEPPRPNEPKHTPTSAARRRVSMANRRGANWPLEAQPWAPAAAHKRVVKQLRQWGYRPNEEAVGNVVTLMVKAAVGDGGRHVSLHLADQNQQALVLVLSHQPGPAPDDTFLPRLAELGASSCGTDSAPDGRRLWALLDL